MSEANVSEKIDPSRDELRIILANTDAVATVGAVKIFAHPHIPPWPWSHRHADRAHHRLNEKSRAGCAMSDEESPLAELARTADEVSNEMYYVRTDGAYRVPMGVMMRFKAAIARAKSEIGELNPFWAAGVAKADAATDPPYSLIVGEGGVEFLPDDHSNKNHALPPKK